MEKTSNKFSDRNRCGVVRKFLQTAFVLLKYLIYINSKIYLLGCPFIRFPSAFRGTEAISYGIFSGKIERNFSRF